MTDARAPPASVGSKTLGIHKYDPEYCIGAGRQQESKRGGYEEKYEDDVLGEELSNEARVWRVMLDEGRVEDVALLQRFRDHLDVDLVFAGLFSAVLTTFVAQTSQLPSSNSNDTTVALLLELVAVQRAWANNPRVDGVTSSTLPSLSPSSDPSPWINRCWFLSLVFSLLAAFGAVVVRQWLQEYESDITGHPKRRALVQHYRRVGLKRYKVHVIVPILPMLLHVSLLLFFIGLVLYVRQSDRSMSNVIIALTVTIYVLYLVTNLLPVFLPQCPYRSPLSTGAYWVKSLLMLSAQCLSTGVSGTRRLVTMSYRLLPVRLISSLSAGTETLKLQIRQLRTFLRDSLRIPATIWENSWSGVYTQLQAFRAVLKESWKEVFRTPSAHEWEAVTALLETVIPNSLAAAIQASSDLSVTPLVVQATSSLPIDPAYYAGDDFEDPRYRDLLRDRVLPWFINALSTRRTVFDWVHGRKNELQRMACSLLLTPRYGWKSNDRDEERHYGWTGIDRDQYCDCVSHILQALVAALRESSSNGAEGDVAALSMTLLALGNRLDDLDRGLAVLRGGALWTNIITAYSSMPVTTPPALLRLRPIVWHHVMIYLPFCLDNYGRQEGNLSQFALVLLRSLNFASSIPGNEDLTRERFSAMSRLTLQQWLFLNPESSRRAQTTIFRLLCPRSCELHEKVAQEIYDHAQPTSGTRMHIACHAIDSYVRRDGVIGNAAFDDQLGFLAVHFARSLVISRAYGSIDSALELIGYSAVSSLFKSTFLARPGLSTVELLKADTTLSPPLAISLFWFLIKLVSAVHETHHIDKKTALGGIIQALSLHASRHSEDLANPLNYYGVFVNSPHLTSLDMHRPVVQELLKDPQLAFLDLWDALSATVAVHLAKQSESSGDDQISGANKQHAGVVTSNAMSKDLIWCLQLDVFLAARATTMPSKSNFSDASLHSALLSLKKDTWKSELTDVLTQNYVPLSLALALNNSHGARMLSGMIGDMHSLLQDENVSVEVPYRALMGHDDDWYRYFAVNPDKYIDADDRSWTLPLSELVSWEEAVTRMSKGRAAANSPRDAQKAAEEVQEAPRAIDVDDGAQDGAAEVNDNEGTKRSRDRANAQTINNPFAACWGWLSRFSPFKGAGQDQEETLTGEV